MAQYKYYSYDQKSLLATDFKDQVLPGIFGYA